MEAWQLLCLSFQEVRTTMSSGFDGRFSWRNQLGHSQGKGADLRLHAKTEPANWQDKKSPDEPSTC